MPLAESTVRSLVARGRLAALFAQIRSGGISLDQLRRWVNLPWFAPAAPLARIAVATAPVRAQQEFQRERDATGLPVHLPPAPPVSPPTPPTPPGGGARFGIQFGRAAPGDRFTQYQQGASIYGRGSAVQPSVRIGDQTGAAFLREVDIEAERARRTRRAAVLDEAVARARQLGQERGLNRAPSQAAATLAARFSSSFTFEFHVPGTHYSGATNQQILEWLDRSGRPFAADTAALRDHVRDAMLDVFGRVEWDVGRAIQVAQYAIRDWIVRRIVEQGLDVSLTALSRAYETWKTAHGFSGQIGIRTGAWLAAVRRGSVVVRA